MTTCRYSSLLAEAQAYFSRRLEYHFRRGPDARTFDFELIEFERKYLPSGRPIESLLRRNFIASFDGVDKNLSECSFAASSRASPTMKP